MSQWLGAVQQWCKKVHTPVNLYFHKWSTIEIKTDRDQMWRFVSSGSSGNHPYLLSLNDNQGRQTWEWDEAAGSCRSQPLICRCFVQQQCTAHQTHIRASAPQLKQLKCLCRHARGAQ